MESDKGDKRRKKMKITKEQWDKYRGVQDSGLFNMFDPQARAMTDLSKQEWLHIIKNYSELKTKHEGK